MKRIHIVLAALFFAVFASASNEITVDLLDGNDWHGLSGEIKAAIVLGMRDGAFLLPVRATTTENVDVRVHDATLHRLSIRRAACRQVVEILDRYYADPANRGIFLIDAYMVSVLALHGVSDADVQARLAALRAARPAAQ